MDQDASLSLQATQLLEVSPTKSRHQQRQRALGGVAHRGMEGDHGCEDWWALSCAFELRTQFSCGEPSWMKVADSNNTARRGW